MDDNTLHQSRILIVDDNPVNVDQLEQLLEFNDFTAMRSTTDPRQVEGLLEEFKPDIVLLDLQMPHMDGFQVLEMLGDKVPKSDFLPVIVLTADITPESRERALKLGAMDFLTKPFDFVEAILRVTNQLRTRRLHLELQGYSERLEEMVRERTAELRRTQEELVAQERYKAMGRMASGIAHDFNNAVGIIMGNAEILLSFPEVVENPKEGAKVLNTIYLASKDAASIVSRLREFYKSDEQEEEEKVVDLRQACKEAVSLTEPRWKRQAQLEGRTIGIMNNFERGIVRMSPSKVREVLTNLIFNAVDAMPDGGTIEISCGEEDGLGVIRVKDDGTGMSEEVRLKCLDMFFSTKGAKGTGLGLGMVNDMVRKHRGTIDIDSEEGKGTTFIVRLPLAESSADPVRGEEGHLLQHLKILIVDDEVGILDVLRRQLTAGGHEVVTAGDAREGLVCFLSGEFDLVITDHAMPAVNGAQLVHSIRRHDADVPVIMQSGFIDAIKAEGGVPEGVNLLLEKPVQISQLRRVIYELFSGRDGAGG